jgi:ABC-type multidrug transport system ATPase subunit
VRLDDVWLRYGRRGTWVLQQVDLDLPPGSVAVLVGANGAGKSTLLAAAAGLLRPGRGQIVDRPDAVGWLPEILPGKQPFTVLEYLTAAARMRRVEPEIDGWAARLGLTPVLRTRMGELSKGTVQKVALVQALLAPPGLLVLDEPADGLDAPTRAELPAIVAERTATGSIVLISDHLGELEHLPGARQLRVHENRVHDSRIHDGRVHAGGPDQRCVIEVAATAGTAAATVAALKAAGHDVLRVRAEHER